MPEPTILERLRKYYNDVWGDDTRPGGDVGDLRASIRDLEALRDEMQLWASPGKGSNEEKWASKIGASR